VKWAFDGHRYPEKVGAGAANAAEPMAIAPAKNAAAAIDAKYRDDFVPIVCQSPFVQVHI
jgi:hypothetical protein